MITQSGYIGMASCAVIVIVGAIVIYREYRLTQEALEELDELQDRKFRYDNHVAFGAAKHKWSKDK